MDQDLILAVWGVLMQRKVIRELAAQIVAARRPADGIKPQRAAQQHLSQDETPANSAAQLHAVVRSWQVSTLRRFRSEIAARTNNRCSAEKFGQDVRYEKASSEEEDIPLR